MVFIPNGGSLRLPNLPEPVGAGSSNLSARLASRHRQSHPSSRSGQPPSIHRGPLHAPAPSLLAANAASVAADTRTQPVKAASTATYDQVHYCMHMADYLITCCWALLFLRYTAPIGMHASFCEF